MFCNLIEGYASQGGKQLVLVEIALSPDWGWVSTTILLKIPYLPPIAAGLIHISINKVFHAHCERWFSHQENTVFLAHPEVNFWPLLFLVMSHAWLMCIECRWAGKKMPSHHKSLLCVPITCAYFSFTGLGPSFNKTLPKAWRVNVGLQQ